MKVTSNLVNPTNIWDNEGNSIVMDSGMTQRALIATEIFARAVNVEATAGFVPVREIAQRAVRAADVLLEELAK